MRFAESVRPLTVIRLPMTFMADYERKGQRNLLMNLNRKDHGHIVGRNSFSRGIAYTKSNASARICDTVDCAQ